MTIQEVQIPAKAAKTRLTDEQLSEAAKLLKAGKTVGTDERYKTRTSAQTAAFKLRREIASRSGIDADTLRGATFQRDGEDDWSVAVAPRK